MFELLCPSFHEKLVYGKCPWCGHTIIDGQDSQQSDCEVQITSVTMHPLNEQGAKEMLPHLLAALRHTNPVLRKTAATVLGQLGPYAKEALPALSRLLHDEDQLVREAAEEAIKRIEK